MMRRGLLGAAAGIGSSCCWHRFVSRSCALTEPQPQIVEEPPSTLFSLTGRTALVTGGSQGLGKAIARGMALAGAEHVIISSRREPELKAALADIIKGTSCKGDYIVCDLSKPGEAERLGREALSLTARNVVDIFVSNAGVSLPGVVHKPASSLNSHIPPLSRWEWDLTIETNLSAGVVSFTLHQCRHAQCTSASVPIVRVVSNRHATPRFAVRSTCSTF